MNPVAKSFVNFVLQHIKLHPFFSNGCTGMVRGAGCYHTLLLLFFLQGFSCLFQGDQYIGDMIVAMFTAITKDQVGQRGVDKALK